MLSDDTSVNFTGDSPIVRDNSVTFHLSFGEGVREAKCAVVIGSQLIEETDCEYS